MSCVCEIGTIPARLARPTVGLIPTTLLTFAGHTMLPSVSVPTLTAAKLAATAAAEPELEPHELRSSEYGLWVRPPRPDQPLVEKKERKFAHSERFVFPRMTAPPARSWAATVESWSAGFPASANEPAVVCILSPVSMLSLRSTGMPCSGPSTWPFARRPSAFWAMARASGLSSITEFTPGPPWSSIEMRST